MSRFVAFLRAINAGRGRTVKMDSLRRLFESLGFTNVETFIASGNVVFEASAKNSQALEGRIAFALTQTLGYPVDTFIRTEAELAAIAGYDPFPAWEIDAAAQFNIIFLTGPIDARLERNVLALKTTTDDFCVHGREIYWLRRTRPEESTFAAILLDKTLPAPFTIRGARTVKRMALKYCSNTAHPLNGPAPI